MKSYGQLCAVARALDIVGDRWTLLVVRELLIEGSLRFTDLQRGLPGIAPNLLTQRLRDLESHGVLERRDAARPGDSATYRLTERGLALDGVVRELLKWGAPTVPSAPPEATFQMHWLSQPARYLLRDHQPVEPAPIVRFGTVADGFDLTAQDGVVAVSPCDPDRDPSAEIAATVSGLGPVLVGMLQGALTLEQALASGVTVEGDRAAVTRFLPRP